jgi:D-inositol-3-phosphate glycosyltransferase
MTGPNGSPRRVLLVSHYFPPHLGGIEYVVHHEATNLARAGAKVTVLTTGRRSTVEETPDGVRVVRVAAWNASEDRIGVPFPITAPRLFSAAVRLARWADIMHVHDCLYMTSWAAGAAAALTSTPYVMTQHVALVEHPLGLVRGVQRSVYAVAGRRLLRRASRVFVVNASVADFVATQGAPSGTVQHLANGVDTDMFRPASSRDEQLAARRRFGLPFDRILVLFAGRLVPKKGYDLLLSAADPAYDLVFAGETYGSERHPDRPGVHHLGRLAPDVLAEAYRACDVFALPSTAEGFPLTVQEAMASGMPVVTTDDPGYAPYELDREHVILLPRDAQSYRETLTALAVAADRRLRMGLWSRRYAAAGFAWNTHAVTLLRHYADVVPAAAGDSDRTAAKAT